MSDSENAKAIVPGRGGPPRAWRWPSTEPLGGRRGHRGRRGESHLKPGAGPARSPSGAEVGIAGGGGRAAYSLALAQHGAPRGPTWASQGEVGADQKGPWRSKELPAQSSWGLQSR